MAVRDEVQARRPDGGSMYLEIRDVSKCYGPLRAVDRVSVAVGRDEFVCLLGPSGCGKTTLLRMISGLVAPDEGRIILDGVDITELPARRRGFGIVFQSYSLFPNMTVTENIGYGLRIRRATHEQISRRVAQLLDLIGLAEGAEKFPHQLSGGQQQRVALARALAVDPKLLLLDEPLSALDAKVRLTLRGEIRDLQRRLGIPTLMVTHDQDEAMTMADRIVCMNYGRVEQVGTPQNLYQRPQTPFVATFLGRMNVLRFDGPPSLDGRPLQTSGAVPASGARICVRPEHIALVDSATETANSFAGHVRLAVYEGNITRLQVAIGDRQLEVETHGCAPRREGDRVQVVIPEEHLTVFPPD